MDSSDEEVLLFSLNLSSGANQKKKKRRKGRRMREIFKKRIEKGVYHNLLQKIRVNDREPHFR